MTVTSRVAMTTAGSSALSTSTIRVSVLEADDLAAIAHAADRATAPSEAAAIAMRRRRDGERPRAMTDDTENGRNRNSTVSSRES